MRSLPRFGANGYDLGQGIRLVLPEDEPLMSDISLRHFSLFSQLGEAEFQQLEVTVQPRDYAARQRLFEMGDPALGVYLVRSGKVKVFRVSPEGSEQVLGVFGAGEEFALAAVFHGGRYPASSETLEASQLFFLEREALMRLIARNPELALSIMGTLAKKVQGLVSMIDSLSLQDARGRLARYLSRRLPSSPPLVVELPMSKTLLSQHLGIKMETLSRTFRGLTDEGVLGSTERGRIEIINRDQLYLAAGDEAPP